MTDTNQDSHFGRFLVRQGAITPQQLADGIKVQEAANRRIGELAMEQELLSPQQVRQILSEQARTDKPFGAIALDMGVLSRDDLDNLLFSQTISGCHIGEALLDLGHITPDQFSGLLSSFLAMEARRSKALKDSVKAMQAPVVMEQVLEVIHRALFRLAQDDFKAMPFEGCDIRGTYPVQAEMRVSLDHGLQVIALLFFSRELLDHLRKCRPQDSDQCQPDHNLDSLLATIHAYLSSALSSELGDRDDGEAGQHISVSRQDQFDTANPLDDCDAVIRFVDTREHELALTLAIRPEQSASM